jgi:hypothetical protein
LILLALPREAHQAGNINGLAEGLGENGPTELQGVSAAAPKPEFPIVVAEWDRNSREVVRVALDHYNGRHTINARVWYHDDDDALRPSKTGITLAVKHLPALADAMAKALAAARDLGLIEGPGNGHGR